MLDGTARVPPVVDRTSLFSKVHPVTLGLSSYDAKLVTFC